ncbi:hypothetical protein Bca52824_077543 [Brassica carinata]|uniref:Uncharacterized protein n=1 Tax=Brassica carinata TaxID=52824 RepID=A0A8X7PZ70_BRACI|nr:hypothetical protein Bca52824_077543 [Brassica carinata]
MSFTIPMISFDWMLPEIALMSVKLSERTLSVENSKILHLTRLIGPLDSPKLPVIVYGDASTGKQLFFSMRRRKLQSRDPSFGEEEEEEDATGYDKETNNNMMVMSDILFQVSSLCDANFIIKSGSCRLEGLCLKVARSLSFPLSKYLYRR